MKSNRRDFIRRMGTFGLGAAVLPTFDLGLFRELESSLDQLKDADPSQVATDESLWRMVRAAYDVPEGFTNLENGYFSAQPLPVLNAFMRETREINRQTSRYMRRHQDDDRETIRKDLAEFTGWDAEEIALTRNTTESLDILISGMDLRQGDEVIVTNFDYGSMLEALEQQARRVGIVLRKINLPIVPESDAELIGLYKEAITSRTKAMLVTQLINLNGQVLPVKELSELGRANGIEVMVDAAHAFAHLNMRAADSGADLYGTSLHKWLSAPLGNGLLRIRKDKIENIWPLTGDTERAPDDIRKFEHSGTRAPAAWLSIREAIHFHNMIGSARKSARLDFLKRRWAEQVADHPRIRLNTSLKPGHSCAIAHVAVEGMSAKALMDQLIDVHGIFTVAVVREPLTGVRVTPALYNTVEDCDALVKALRELAG